jgi:IS30 family transposase
MPRGYHHLTQDQRCQIYTLKKSGNTQSQIALHVGVNQSVISRELKINCGERGYRYKQAHEKAAKRRSDTAPIPHKMHPEMIEKIEIMLREKKWSPEQISGRLKLNEGISISHECIYLYIWRDQRNGGNLFENLRRIGKKYNKRRGKLAGRGLIPNRVGIEHRPAEVETKVRVGDFEVDTIIGADHRGAIVSLVDRKTKVTFLGLISGPKSSETATVIINRLGPLKSHVHTVTSDNGKEFAEHESIAKKLNLKFFFARPYHSWERGLNENTNGLVRQYFPKGCDFTKLTRQEVLGVEAMLNDRPRKTLGYKTPNEEYFRLTGINLKNYALRG